MSLFEARDTLTIDGPDAARYLQGQLSNDVNRLAVGDSCWSLLLEPSGKLGFLVRVRRTAGDGFVLDTDEGVGQAIETRLRRFLIRTKVTIAAAACVVDVSAADDGDLVGWWAAGRHSLVDPVAADSATVSSQVSELRAAKVRAGWPSLEAELVEGLIPGELGIVGVTASFTKGCYTGQELVARVDSRGNNVPRLLHRVRSADTMSPGTPVVNESGATVGAITSAAGHDALAFIQRGTVAGDPISVGGAPAELLPIQPA